MVHALRRHGLRLADVSLHGDGVAPVTVVSPINRLTIVFRLYFSRLLNPQHEVFGGKVIIGTVISLAGAVLLSLSTDLVSSMLPLPDGGGLVLQVALAVSRPSTPPPARRGCGCRRRRPGPSGVTRIEFAEVPGGRSATLWPRASSARTSVAAKVRARPRPRRATIGDGCAAPRRPRRSSSCGRSRSRITCSTMVMMRLPPGEPVTRNGLPSWSTMVGDIEDSGRLPGPGALASPPTRPIGVRRAGLGGEVVELVVEQDAGAFGDQAEAVAEIQRVGVGDGVAEPVDHRKMRGVVAFARRALPGRMSSRRPRALGIDARAQLRRIALRRRGARAAPSTQAGSPRNGARSA